MIIYYLLWNNNETLKQVLLKHLRERGDETIECDIKIIITIN